jgi:hypothetical protein
MRSELSKRKVTQAEVDRIVTEQAAEESARERPVVVSRPKWTSLALRIMNETPPSVDRFGSG